MTYTKLKQYGRKLKRKHVKSDGFLTKTGAMWNYKEIHSFGIGLIDGFMMHTADHKKRLQKWRDEHKDVESQPHYFTKGFFLGRKSFYLSIFVFLALVLVFLAWLF